MEVRLELRMALKEYSGLSEGLTDLVQLAFGAEHCDAELVALHSFIA
jgi:hypothetical protein